MLYLDHIIPNEFNSHHMQPSSFPGTKSATADSRYIGEGEIIPRAAANSGKNHQQLSQATISQYWENLVKERKSIGQQFLSCSQMQRETAEEANDGTSSSNTSLAKKTLYSSDRCVVPTFPEQLFDVLAEESLSDIITWLPHGQGWIILDRQRFASDVLPEHFEKKSKWTSFTRKLNRWNFTRVTRGEEVGAYYHNLFQRGRKDLCMQMTCMGSKAPQSLEPLNPVALGLATPNMVQQGLLSSAARSSGELSTTSQGSVQDLNQAQHPPRFDSSQNQVSNPMAASLQKLLARNQLHGNLPVASSVPSSSSQQQLQSLVQGSSSQQQQFGLSNEDFEPSALPMQSMFQERPTASPNPVMSYPWATQQQEQEQQVTNNSQWEGQQQSRQFSPSEPPSAGAAMDQRTMMELYAKIVQQQQQHHHHHQQRGGNIPPESGSSCSQSSHPQQLSSSAEVSHDTLTLTPISNSEFVRQQQQQQQHVPGKFPSISGARAAEYPEEDQKISPSMFDSSSCSDYSDLADNDAPPRPPAITKMAMQHQTTPAPAPQHPALQQQQQHPKSTLDSTVFHLKTSGSFTHGFPSSASRDERARLHGDSRGMQQHSSNHHHHHHLHHLQRNYLEAIMLLEQKNGLHDQQQQQQQQGSPYHNNPSSSQRRRPGDGRRQEE